MKKQVLYSILVNIDMLPIKTKIVLHDKICNTSNKCQSKIINILQSTKYLDLEMCFNMKWKETIFSVVNKIRKIIYMIKELRDTLKEKGRLIYLGLAKSIIANGIMGWEDLSITF